MSRVPSLVVLSSDTPHHRYFINRLVEHGFTPDAVFFETTHVEPPFATGPLFEEEELAFEREAFFEHVSYELQGVGRVVEVENLNDPESRQLLGELSPGFGVVFGTRKLSSEVLGLFEQGLINVHRGIAQAYRGLDSDLWAIYHRDWGNIGVTIHRVEPRLDTGDVVAQRSITLRRGMKIHQIRYETTLVATELVLDALEDFVAGTLSSVPQEELGRYYSFMPLALKRLMQRRFNVHCEGLP